MKPAVLQRLRRASLLRWLVWVLLVLLPIQYSSTAIASAAELHQASAAAASSSEVGDAAESVDRGQVDCAADCGQACACTCHHMADAVLAEPLPQQRTGMAFVLGDRPQPRVGLLPHRIERPKWPRIA